MLLPVVESLVAESTAYYGKQTVEYRAAGKIGLRPWSPAFRWV